jgi:hypothetical protein
MQAIGTLVGDSGMETGDLQACLVSIPRPYLLTRMVALGMRQLTLIASQVLGMYDLLAVAQHCDIFQVTIAQTKKPR